MREYINIQYEDIENKDLVKNVMQRDIVLCSNSNHNFNLFSTINESYVLRSSNLKFEPTIFEEKIIGKYFYDELGFDKSYTLNPSSSLILLLTDYARFSDFH